MVGAADDRLFMFNNEQSVAFVAEAFQDLDESVGVARMQANAGFIQDEKGIHQ